MAINASQMSLNAVSTVAATAEPGVFIVKCNITDIEGNTYDTDYCSHPDDAFGLNQKIRQWLADNPEFPIRPCTPPTGEEIRVAMPSLTARQFRLGLLNAGISPSQIAAVIEELPSGADKDKVQIEWEYATKFGRSHHLIGTICSILGVGDEQIDSMWAIAVDL